MTKVDYSVAALPKNESSGRGGGGGAGTRAVAAAAPTTGLGLRTWLGLKDPRIVRVSRTFGGKDRHSKVSTVKGLRDRRVRLSVQTAIQLYDLQERLGLSQPSKVVDWLLNATQTEIDKLPPLQMPPSSYPTGQFVPSGNYYTDAPRSNRSTAAAAAAGGGWKLLVSNADDRRKKSPAEGSDHAAPGGGGGGGGGGQFLHSNSTLVFPTSGAGVYSTASFFQMDPLPQPPAPEPAGVTMACLFSSQEANNQTELSNGFYHHHRLMSPPGSLSLMAGARQLMLSPVMAMPTISFHSGEGASPVVDHVVSGHHVVAAPTTATAATSQNFFSGSLFASFPSVVPAATRYHIPK